MEPTSASKVSQRLPNLLTMFFSISLVSGFRALVDFYHWTTAPVFNVRDASHVLVMLSYVTTLYFVVSVWLAFNVLIERNPYTLNFGRFYFDVARFALMFALLMWSFLVAQPGHFQWYIFGLAAWHLLMTVWYIGQRRSVTGEVKRERSRDMRIHGTVVAVYFVLGLAYVALVTSRTGAAQVMTLHIALATLTLLVVIFWTSRRLAELRLRLLDDSAPPAVAA